MKAAIIKDGKVVNIAKVADVEFAESQGWVVSDAARIGDSYDAETGEFGVTLPEPVSPEQLLSDLEDARKTAEAQGVTINGIRYAGDPDNRQALNESLQFAAASNLTTFAGWKDSDGVFHDDHPVTDVQAAYESIGYRRGALIALEGKYAAQITNGEVTNIDELSWEI